MARPRSHKRKTLTDAELDELVTDGLLGGTLRPSQCRVDDLGRRWCPVCDTGWRCRSNFDTEADAEAAYWANRDAVVAAFNVACGRPWTWWRWEAPGVCGHRPRCPIPQRDDFEGTAGEAQDALNRACVEWLDAHGQLSARERAELARREAERARDAEGEGGAASAGASVDSEMPAADLYPPGAEGDDGGEEA